MSTVVSQRLELLISAYAGEKVKRAPKTQERSYQGPDQSRPSVLRGIQWDSYHCITMPSGFLTMIYLATEKIGEMFTE